MKYSEVNNKEICIIIEDAIRCDKVVVWGCFYGKGGKRFQRYFKNLDEACIYYNNQLNKGVEKYLVKSEVIKNGNR